MSARRQRGSRRRIGARQPSTGGAFVSRGGRSSCQGPASHRPAKQGPRGSAWLEALDLEVVVGARGRLGLGRGRPGRLRRGRRGPGGRRQRLRRRAWDGGRTCRACCRRSGTGGAALGKSNRARGAGPVVAAFEVVPFAVAGGGNAAEP